MNEWNEWRMKDGSGSTTMSFNWNGHGGGNGGWNKKWKKEKEKERQHWQDAILIELNLSSRKERFLDGGVFDGVDCCILFHPLSLVYCWQKCWAKSKTIRQPWMIYRVKRWNEWSTVTLGINGITVQWSTFTFHTTFGSTIYFCIFFYFIFHSLPFVHHWGDNQHLDFISISSIRIVCRNAALL